MSKLEEGLRDALAAADTAAALAVAEQIVRSDPAHSKGRVALFQLMCVRGQWQRALAQLDALGKLDAQTLAMAATYREVIKCEMLRARVFAGEATPMAFGEPQAWLAWLVEAVHADAQGDPARAADLRRQAFDVAQFPSGSADGAPFDWIADSDLRLGPVCEAMVSGRYYWMPLTAVAQLDLDPPEDLRDMVWLPAHFRFVNGGETVGFVPTRYAGTESCADGALQLARRTEWQGQGEGEPGFGLGQRVFATDTREIALLDLRKVVFDAAPAAA